MWQWLLITGFQDFVNRHKSIIVISLLLDCGQVVWYQIFIFSILFLYFGKTIVNLACHYKSLTRHVMLFSCSALYGIGIIMNTEQCNSLSDSSVTSNVIKYTLIHMESRLNTAMTNNLTDNVKTFAAIIHCSTFVHSNKCTKVEQYTAPDRSL